MSEFSPSILFRLIDDDSLLQDHSQATLDTFRKLRWAAPSDLARRDFVQQILASFAFAPSRSRVPAQSTEFELLLPCLTCDELSRLKTLAEQTHTPVYATPGLFNRYHRARVAGADALPRASAVEATEQLAAVIREWPIVDAVYPELYPSLPPAVCVSPSDLDPATISQDHLEIMGIEPCWALDGGRGEKARLIDVEDAWGVEWIDREPGWAMRFHQCLPKSRLAVYNDSIGPDHAIHGTAVLGLILAQHHASALKGISPLGTTYLISSHECGREYALARAILDRQEGDIILLEAQEEYPRSGVCLNGPERCFLPAEVNPLTLELLRLATALGSIVVESAGNGGQNLDNVESAITKQKSHPDGVLCSRPSGAIVVGSGTAAGPDRYTNYGRRVDCYAPGGPPLFTAWTVGTGGRPDTFADGIEVFDALAEGCAALTDDPFGHTSAAAAMVAGLVLNLQSLHLTQGLAPLTADQLRAFLRHPDVVAAPHPEDLVRCFGCSDSAGPAQVPNLVQIGQRLGLRPCPKSAGK